MKVLNRILFCTSLFSIVCSALATPNEQPSGPPPTDPDGTECPVD